MNLWALSASELLGWGIVLHLIADLPLQSDWMAKNKMLRRQPKDRQGDGLMTPPRMYTPATRWWIRHPAAYVHAGIHGLLLAVIFGWTAIPLAVAHLLIDTRKPVAWWSKLMRQTQPEGFSVLTGDGLSALRTVLVVDMGTLVRFAMDQTFHIICVAIAALIVA